MRGEIRVNVAIVVIGPQPAKVRVAACLRIQECAQDALISQNG